MTIRFEIYKKSDSQTEKIDTISFSDDKKVIKIGREIGLNDVVLKDELNHVSNEHAVIEFRDGNYFIKDLKSKNGTLLNNDQISSEAGILLTDNCIIKIANYELVCGLFFEELSQHSNADLPISATETPEPSPDILERHTLEDELSVKTLASELRATYKKHGSDEPKLRKQALQDIISKFIEENEVKNAKEILINLKKIFPDRGYEMTQLQNLAYKELVNMLNELVDKELSFSSGKEISHFYQQIKIVIEKLLKSFTDLEIARRKVLEDIIFIWDDSQFKSPLFDKPIQEIVKALLEWQEKRPEKREDFSVLDKSLQIIILHQLALLQGYQEATYRGSLALLERLDPKRITSELNSRVLSIGKIKIPYKFLPPLAKILTWSEFKKRYQQFQIEEKQTFEAFFRPSFAAKYKEIVQQHDEADKTLEQTRVFFLDQIKEL